MARLRRFESYRFLGRRDLMRVYDTEDPVQAAELEAGLSDLVRANLIQTFAPDTLPEAANRGFRPASSGQPDR
jgi:hypothetical protein